MKPPTQMVHGHRIGDVLYDFPHLCPGYGCAIADWLAAKHSRGNFEGLIVGKKKPEMVKDGRD